MADYTTSAAVKSYIGTSEPDDDALIASLITRASQRIDTYTRRTFVRRAETRYFDAVKDVSGLTLYVDDDLIYITSITNGDGSAVDSADVVQLPANRLPKYAVKIKASAGISWTWETDPEQAITIAGSWGYRDATTPPDDIAHAAIRLTAWYYHQRQAPFETIGFPDLGQVVVPADVPADIRGVLDTYVRNRV
jgi:hypothetical protein